MRISTKSQMPFPFVTYPIIATLMLYVFFYQLAYPFSSTLFLYVAFAGAVAILLFLSKIRISTQMIIMALVTVVSAIGVIYTKSPDEGSREAVLTLVVWVMLISFAQNRILLDRLKKTICIFSLIVFLGVLFQYLFPNMANDIFRSILRKDSYEQLIRSFEVDGAYAGFSAYTPDAAYFCAALFGFAIFGWLQGKGLSFTKKIMRIAVIVLSVFAIILTSKRGVAIALLVSFVITYMVWKKFSVKTIVSVIGLIVVASVLLYIFSEQNEEIGLFFRRFNATDGDITTGRTEIWRNAWENLSNIFVGMGTGASYSLYEMGLHNIYLQLLFDHGLIGLIIYLLFFASNLISAIKRNEPIAIYMQLLLLVYGFSGNPLYSNSFFIVYVIFSIVPLGDNIKQRQKTA